MNHPEATPQRKKLGPYQLGLLLGRGGMGEVYKAFDERLGRWVAAKRLHGDATAKARQRFRREARTLAQLGHPAIVQVFDVVDEAGGDWIVMELVDGPTLAELVRHGPLDVGLALDYARQVASALEAAHARGIVHRDLKTENVMVMPSGHLKVLDFGLARRVTSMSREATLPEGLVAPAEDARSRPGRVVGTPRAMSPEQAAGRDVDARSDLFSLGVLLYEVLTARSPFVARTIKETLSRVRIHVPPPARQLDPNIPHKLSQLIDRLLEKDPVHRPQTAAAVEAELVAITAADPVYLVATHSRSRIEAVDVSTIPDDAPQDEAPGDDVVVKALLVSDLVDSTQLVGKLLQRHDRLARELLENHGGREIDRREASLAALFDRPWNAVSYALAYHEGLRELQSSPPAPQGERGLAARVGIHLGEVIVRRNTPRDVDRGAHPIEVEGLAKATAARLMALATGAQILLTRAAYDVARRSAASEGQALEWRAHGCYRFKGISDEVEVFEVGVAGVAPLEAPAGAREHRPVDPTPSVAGPASVLVPSRPVKGGESLRCWPPPELPEHPYPVLLPYTHPDFMAGRDQEIARLRRLLEMPVPILGLSAPSGTGKSSLLIGGLVPTLRAAGRPVALVRHPAEAGVASRLIGDLLDGPLWGDRGGKHGAEPVDDSDAPGFVERLAEVERLAGVTPVLVLDQFEDVLHEDAPAARTVLGPLMAASVARRPGLVAPPCRWLIAYRQELFGQLDLWLGDVLADARVLPSSIPPGERTAGVAGIEALPHDLSQPERFHSMTLPPLATPSPVGRDWLAESTRVFLAAIEKPLSSSSGSPLPLGEGSEGLGAWHFPPGHAERLAHAFAEARLACPDAPLAPELQVVLAHLLAQAGADGRITVPDDPGPLIDQALDDHLRRALETAFPEGTSARATRRARALLALRELATSSGQRDEGLRPDELARAIGHDGEAILDKLATPLTRLVVVREAPDGPRWVLAHDRMAEAVVRLVEEEGRYGQLLVDTELLALRRFVTLRTALYRSDDRRGETSSAARVPRHHFRRIEDNAEALLWDDERRDWFTACRRRRRADRRRLGGLVSLAVLVLALVGWGAWDQARRMAEHRALLERVVQGEPPTALQALDELATRPDADFGELLTLVRQRGSPMDVLERGLGGIDGSDRSAAVLRAVEIALPWVEETPEDQVLVANLVWALDFAPSRDPHFAERARALRDRVLEPLRRLRPPPSVPLGGPRGGDTAKPQDPDWIHIPAGTFLMGTGSGEEGFDNERPQHEVSVSAFRMQRHEVTNVEYRRLVPDHPSAGRDGDDDLPAAFVDWYAAYTYAAWLGGRLPTEAEWEYAARAGCPHAYCTRDGQETTVDAVAWTLRNSATGELTPRPVMELEPNPWGLYDMLGNLWEWTADWYGVYQDGPQSNPWGPAASSGGRRVCRGGSFRYGADWTRVANRYWNAPGSELVNQGLRAVLPGRPEP